MKICEITIKNEKVLPHCKLCQPYKVCTYRIHNSFFHGLKVPWQFFSLTAVTPEPDSTEDSTGGFDPTDLPTVVRGVTNKSPNSRRMSQPITGTPKEPDSNEPSNTRRASEGMFIKNRIM